MPGASVVYPTAKPRRKHTVFTAPQAAAAGSSSSSRGRIACFSGMVTLQPSQAPARAAARNSGRVSGVTVTVS